MATTDPAAQLRAWLQAGDWNALRAHFASAAPATALGHQARALLHINSPEGKVDWAPILADLRRACELEPGNPVLWVNLSQALLDSGQPGESFEAACKARDLAPAAYPVLEKLAVSAVATQRWDEALKALQDARAAATAAGQQATKLVEGALQELLPRWWMPLRSGGLTLRRPVQEHLSFITSVVNDASFMRQYNRFQSGSDRAIQSLVAGAQLSPYQTRRIDWVAEDRSGAPIGLGAIVDIDWVNRRGEFALGFPGRPPGTAALKAAVAILDFAFARLGLEKLVSYVYSDNPTAQANTLHLGFAQEGVLREHVAALERAGRLDLYVNGMLAREFLGSERYRSLRERWLKAA